MKVKVCFYLWIMINLDNNKKQIPQKQKGSKRRPYDRSKIYVDHALPDFDSIGPKINTNNPSKKLSREEHERMLQGISH